MLLLKAHPILNIIRFVVKCGNTTSKLATTTTTFLQSALILLQQGGQNKKLLVLQNGLLMTKKVFLVVFSNTIFGTCKYSVAKMVDLCKND